jgi:response regulator RpfG family c-di-GMP phosphodiesterase
MADKQDSILIVDDEEPIRRLLHDKLSGEGYRCYEAADAGQALKRLRNNTIGLVMLDIRMPGKSGVELLSEIKTHNPHVSVIMITAAADMHVAVQCMRRGAYDYIAKPFDLEGVAISVARALERRRLELENEEYQQHLKEKVSEQASEIRTSFLNGITSLAYALEAKDSYTSGHSKRVADISAAVAQELDLSKDKIDRLKLAGLVHDIGKIGISESILNKPSSLTEREFEQVRRHPEIGEHILSPIVDAVDILESVRNHHERYDGKGYPDALAKKQIPLGARIMAVSDAYEAMTSERPYRRKMSDEDAREEIKRNRGTQFDPEIADIFLLSKSIRKAIRKD